MIVVEAVNGNEPGFETSPSTLYFLLLTCCTMTVTSGDVMKPFSFSVMLSSN